MRTKKHKHTCQRCGVVFERLKNNNAYKFCSRSCAKRPPEPVEEICPPGYSDKAMHKARAARENDRRDRELRLRERLKAEIQRIRWTA